MDPIAEVEFVKAPLSSRVIQLDVTVTAQRFVIPTAMAGCSATFSAFSDVPTTPIYVGILFGDSTVTATVKTVDSTVSTGVITPGATTAAVLISDRDVARWIIPSNYEATHFSVIGDGAGKLIITKD